MSKKDACNVCGDKSVYIDDRGLGYCDKIHYSERGSKLSEDGRYLIPVVEYSKSMWKF